jgi:hypothetical protein
MISILKITLGGVALSLDEKVCNRPLKFWICFMMLHDFCSVCARVSIIYMLNRSRRPQEGQGSNNNENSEEDSERGRQLHHPIINDNDNGPQVYYNMQQEDYDDERTYPDVALKVCRV